MLLPSEKLKKFIETFSTRGRFCEILGIDEAVLSRLLKGERGASASLIESIHQLTDLPFEEAWEVVKDKEEVS